MSPELIGVIGILVLLTLFLLKIPVGISLISVGAIGYSLLRGWDVGFGLLGTTIFTSASSYSLSVIPLYILMGMFLSYSGLGKGIYQAVNAWVGHIRGGLAMATVGTGAIFASISGSVAATTATMARIALPEMKKYNYDPKLSTASVAAGGSLGPLIPPSVMMIIYGIFTMQSIGKLLIAGIVPGIILTFFFMGTIYFLVLKNPDLAPRGEKIEFEERIRLLKNILPFLILFFISIGGLYFGFFTPTEAGGIGALGALLLTIISRRMNWEYFRDSLSDATRNTAMIFLILIGANIFSQFLTLSRIPTKITLYVSQLELSPYVILTLILILLFILGLFLEGIAIFTLTLPVIYPMITELGFDGIWFGVIMIIIMNVGLLTPPLGVSIYIISGFARDVPIGEIFLGAIPMFLTMILSIIFFTLFPEIITFLPELMRN